MNEDHKEKELYEMSADLASTSGCDSPRKPIKSTAVVKLSISEAPANFEKLTLNTNLNEPPSNWLSTKQTNGSPFGFSNPSGFNSFRIANMFPDCVGEVDVVSDAENIKKLLKIPYSKGPVSMIVHRVENTLLIDEFDIHKHLMRTAESEWKWLRKFFFEHIMSTLSSKGLYQKDFSRDAVQERRLVSKFLYHSLREAAEMDTPEKGQTSKEDDLQPEGVPMHWSSLPEPQIEMPDNSVGHEFARNVVWTFEDIQMLLGTDMPIFGGDTHPCISLRLRDMKKPINVLTGIDYWLDNLMCNVPEVVMCYHLDGLVQKYELIKTEDLPHLPGSKFSPKLIHDVAQNILSFLKSNATTPGHTYWLFKGKNDDVVKLYDLTTLCNNDQNCNEENPFTVPVAMLLYKVARNMKRHDSKQHGCIKMLLEHCISLLSKEKHTQVVTSAHYMLADLYVPAETSPSNPAFPEEEEDASEKLNEEEEPEEFEENGNDVENVEIGSLCWKNSCTKVLEKTTPPPLIGSVYDRCRNSLRHISDGLVCLRQLDTRQIQQEEEEPKMAHPFTAIPMPYTNMTSMVVSPTKAEERQPPEPPDQWKAQLLTLLYEKALLVTAVMTQNCVTTEQFGAALRLVQVLLTLNLGLQKLAKVLGVKHGKESEMAAMKSFLLGQAGDACCMIVQNWNKVEQYRSDINTKDELIEPILKQMQLDVGPTYDDTVPVDLDLPNVEDVLRSSLECYIQAVNSKPPADQVPGIQRRIGNIHNELGVFYMTQASAVASERGVKDSQFQVLVKKSLSELEAGISAFEKVADVSNLALLLLNTGRLMRLCSHAMSPSCRTPLQGQERNYYVKALNYYQRALFVLGERSEKNEQIWDSVNWQLSTTLYNMAVILQDYPDNSEKNQEELEKEVVEHLQKALQACDLTTPGRQQPMYQFRAASIHHRLASLYHKSLRNCCGDDHKKKFIQQLCKMHYEKSAEMYKSLEGLAEFLRVQLERVAFAEFSAECTNGVGGKKSLLVGAVDLILGSEDVLKVVMKQKETPDDEDDEQLKLVLLMEQRLQCILLSLAKLSSKDKANAKETHFKAMYAATLHRSNKEKEELHSAASRLCSTMQKVSELKKSV
ncbi:erythroid differentiation-related factor 1 [Neocloeon triangulifer]|uniref:erythroid differentiation-related factor 1 n=1 Tax=Neocloeon triangulifer TaxID=2078957 RepID=UPI00286F3BD2|nr:erythroid differentiation-related factor 1 [Neocloeon triangulifer]